MPTPINKLQIEKVIREGEGGLLHRIAEELNEG